VGSAADERRGTMAVDSFKFMSKTLANSLKVWPYVDTSGEEIPWAPLEKDPGECMVAMISSGGFYCKDDEPFDLERERREPLWGDPSFREIPRGTVQEDIRAAHLHYNNEHPLVDFNCMFPLDALEDLLAAGEIGDIAPYHFSLMGYQPKLGTLINKTAPRIAERLAEMGVDLVFLSPG
jgi:D-proline reductase (dithiol) PrdB